MMEFRVCGRFPEPFFPALHARYFSVVYLRVKWFEKTGEPVRYETFSEAEHLSFTDAWLFFDSPSVTPKMLFSSYCSPRNSSRREGNRSRSGNGEAGKDPYGCDGFSLFFSPCSLKAPLGFGWQITEIQICETRWACCKPEIPRTLKSLLFSSSRLQIRQTENWKGETEKTEVSLLGRFQGLDPHWARMGRLENIEKCRYRNNYFLFLSSLTAINLAASVDSEEFDSEKKKKTNSKCQSKNHTSSLRSDTLIFVLFLETAWLLHLIRKKTKFDEIS